MKKTLSVFLAVVMMISVFSVSSSAFAAENGTYNVTFTGHESNGAAQQAVEMINNERRNRSSSQYTNDERLTSVARQRAKELFVFYSNALPNGQSIQSYIPDYNDNEYGYLYLRLSNSSPSTYDIYSSISDLIYLKNEVQSIGVGVFTVKDYTAVYVLVSTKPAYPCTYFVDSDVTATVNTLPANVSYNISLNSNSKYVRYDAQVLLSSTYGLLYDYDVTNQFSFKTDNSKVCKAKKNILYPKKSGKFTVTAKNNIDSSIAVKRSDSIYGLDNVKVKKASAKSTKKKKVTVKWSYNISDADGYEIQYSTSKSFKKGKNTKTVISKGNKKFSKTISKLKSKKTYYVRVRGYLNQGNGEKFYGKYSKTVKVRVK